MKIDRDHLLFLKAERSNLQFNFIGVNDKKIIITDPTLQRIQKAWRIIDSPNSSDGDLKNQAWDVLDEVCELIPGFPKSSLLRKLRVNNTHSNYVALINSKGFIPKFEINSLINQIQITEGFLPVHASAVVHNGALFLFAGKSGAGKSTIANLSAQIGDIVLDEDQVMIRNIGFGMYSANAWGYGLTTCDYPIRAVIKLQQAKEEKLIPISQSQTSKILFEQVLQITGVDLPSDIMRMIFQFSSSFSRSIPGYILHFCKSPTFWKLIDQQNPGK